MSFDIQDVLADALGSVFGRSLQFALAIWLGCTLGAAAIHAGVLEEARDSGDGFFVDWIWASPLLLLSSWALLNIPFLLFSVIRFIREEGDDFLTIGLVIGVQSLAVMAGWAHDFVIGWMPLAIAWGAWLILVTLMGTGLWFARQSITRSRLRNLARLREENERMRAPKEEERAQKCLEDGR